MSRNWCNWTVRVPWGWYCTREVFHDGPCALHPKWWAHPVLWWRNKVAR